jgi:NAD-dependent dihydropyrimidine dehydrogenase PreA subunit
VPPIVSHPEKCANWKRNDRKKAVCEICLLTCPDHALEWDERIVGQQGVDQE